MASAHQLARNYSPAVAAASRVTLARHIQKETHHSSYEEQQAILTLFTALQVGIKMISNAIRRAGIEKLLGVANDGVTNFSGDVVKKLDLVSNEAFVQSMINSELVSVMASEEDKEVIVVSPKETSGRFCMCFDPLDGSSNIDANVSIGTIFGIFKKESTGDGTKADVLRPARELMGSGYALYGTCTMIVFTTGHSVNGFTLDEEIGEFILTHPGIRMPPSRDIYSVNEGNSLFWEPGTKQFIDMVKGQDGRKPYSSRYIGSMVADVHRTLLYGGVFMYPGDSRSPDGKLRYLYEVGPLSHLVEKAGGRAVIAYDGDIINAVDLQPTQIHQRVPIYLGSREVIDELCKVKAAHPSTRTHNHGE